MSTTQQNTPTLNAYLAGLIDGEACIRVQRQSQRESQYLPQIKIASVTPEVSEYLEANVGGWTRKYQPPSANGNAREAYEWCLQGRKAVLHLMRAIQPHCIVKRRQVELMIRFITEGEPSTPPTPVSEQEIARRRQIFEEFGRLNVRGRNLAT